MTTLTGLKWTLAIWILKFFLMLKACSHLPAPQNLTFVSWNLEHKLSWMAGPGTPTSSRFRVQSSHDCKRKRWEPIVNCSDLQINEPCDLTTAFRNAYCEYMARVQAFTPEQESNWTNSRLFSPLTDTVLGPPLVSLTGCGNCLVLQLSPPASRGNRRHLELYFREYSINVSRTRDKAQFMIRVSSGESVINHLEPGEEYCITALPLTVLHRAAVHSASHCAYTSHKLTSGASVFVAVLCAVSLLVALCCTALIYSGLLVPREAVNTSQRYEDDIWVEDDEQAKSQRVLIIKHINNISNVK